MKNRVAWLYDTKDQFRKVTKENDTSENKGGNRMSLEKEERIIIPDENGEEHLFEVLFTFDLDQTEETYVSVVPAEQNEG